MTRIALIGVAWMSLCASASAQDIEDLAWLEGVWRDPENGRFEEIWSAPAGGVTTAMFRMTNGDQLVVLEYVLVSQESDGIFYRFNHFNAGYSTWEGDGPPIELRLVESGPGRAIFQRTEASHANGPEFISYVRDAPDRMRIIVGGPVSEPDNPDTFVLAVARTSGSN